MKERREMRKDALKMKLMRKRTLTFNDSVLNMIGKSYGEIKKVWGAANGIYAYGGEIGFLFDRTVFYYFMDEYDMTVGEPKIGSVCYGAGCKFGTCIRGMEKRMYSFAELEEKMGITINSFETDEDDEIGVGFTYTHEFSCDGLMFRFYSDSFFEVEPGCIVFASLAG